MTIKRYGIYRVDLHRASGKEMSQARAVVVVSDSQMNSSLANVVVCPLTTTIHPRWPSRIQTSASGTSAEVAVDQISTISKARIGEQIGVLGQSEAEMLRHVITIMYGVLAE